QMSQSATADLPAALATIVDDFDALSQSDRLQLLLEFSEELPDLPERYTDHPELLEPVPECQSPIFLIAEVEGTGAQSRVRLFFSAPQEAPTTRGFAGILAEGLDGLTDGELLAIPSDVPDRLGLKQAISPLRLRGMAGRIKRQLEEKAGLRRARTRLTYPARVIIAGAMHYFRVHPEQRRGRLETLAAMGVDSVETYVAWNLHERRRGSFDFTGIADLGHFLDTAGEVGLNAIVRPGPYICAEWDNGGLPAWLTGIPGIRVRTSDPVYVAEVDRWFDELIPVIAARQTTRGGNVTM